MPCDLYATLRAPGVEIGKLVSVRGKDIFPLSCCEPFFEVGKIYPVQNYWGTTDRVLSFKLENHFDMIILNGSVDGYDKETGVQFTTIESANGFFFFAKYKWELEKLLCDRQGIPYDD